MTITIQREPARVYNNALRSCLPDHVERNAACGDRAAKRVMVAYRAHRKWRSDETWREFLAADAAYRSGEAK